jgi:hypothetical protein
LLQLLKVVMLHQPTVPQEVEAVEAVKEKEEEDSVPEEAEVVVEEEEEVVQVEEEETKKNGLHSPSSVDSSSTDISSPSKKFTLTPSQLRKLLSLIDSLPTPRLNFPMKSCASFPSKSKLRPVKEPDSRLLLPLETEWVTLVSVSSALRKSKLPSRVLSLMPRSILSQSEEDIGVQESVESIPSQLKLRESAVLVPLEWSQPQEELDVLPLWLPRRSSISLVLMMSTPLVSVKPELERISVELFSSA